MYFPLPHGVHAEVPYELPDEYSPAEHAVHEPFHSNPSLQHWVPIEFPVVTLQFEVTRLDRRATCVGRSLQSLFE